MGSKARGRIRVRRIGLLLVVFDLVVLAGMLLTRVDAAPTDVGLSPSEGVVGTTVTVTGSACFPSLLVNPAQVSVTGFTLGVNVNVVVPAGGACRSSLSYLPMPSKDLT